MKSTLSMVLLVVAAALEGLDLGGSVDSTLTVTTVQPDWTSSLAVGSTLHLWAGGDLSPGNSILFKANLSNAYTQTLQGTPAFSDTVAGAVEYALFSTSVLKVGRTDFRDFSGTVLSTKLDGLQVDLSSGNVDFYAYLGTSASLFKSGSTVIISEDDVKDRQIAEDFRQPSTLWAAPRLIGGVGGDFRQWIPDQTFHWGLLGQYDLRPNLAVADGLADTDLGARKGAPVSTAYGGLGWNGRVAGPVYAGAWAYASGGTSLSAVGVPSSVTGSGKGATTTQYKTWKPAFLLAGVGGLDVTFLMPTWSGLLINAGLLVGSWDADGAAPEDNAADSPTSTTPTLYTGWVGVSRTGGSLIFNPQPANMATAQLVVSVKPLETVQVASSSFAFVRPSLGAITETGLTTDSQERYLGVESDLAILWRPTSDWGGSVSLGGFLPNQRALARELEMKAQVSVSLSF